MLFRKNEQKLTAYERRAATVSMTMTGGVFLLAGFAADDAVFQPKLPDAAAIVHSIHERVQLHGEEAVLFLLDEHLFGETPAYINVPMFDPGPKVPADPGPADAWLKAIHENFDHGKLAVRVGRRAEPLRSIPLERAASANSIVDDATTPDCRDGVEWAEKSAACVQEMFAKRSAVVFVTDRPPRVTWTRPPEPGADRDACWSPTWHEEEVGKTLARCGAELIVVAPETAFGEDTPVPLARFLPWASRPVAAGRSGVAGFTVSRAERDAEMSGTVFEKDAAFGFGTWPRFRGVLPCDLSFIDPKRPDLLRSAETDIPSGFGPWEYSRVCQITRGALFPMPRATTEWLDPCKRSDRARAMAPSIDRSAAEQWNEQRTNPLSQSARRIVRRLLDQSEPFFRSEPLFPYCELPRLVHRQRDRKEPQAPFEILSNAVYQQRELSQWREFARSLAPLVADYDAGVVELEAAIETAVRIAPPGSARGSRLVADARLLDYWLRTSAFHLSQLEEVCARPEETLLEPKEHTQYGIIGTSAVRMSDLLRAYDDAFVDPNWDAAEFPLTRDAEEQFGGFFSSLFGAVKVPEMWKRQRIRNCTLIHDPFDPLYRAQRYPGYAMQLLSPSGRERVTAIFRIATRLHEELAQTPWDWMVYFDELHTFNFLFDPCDRIPNPPPGESHDKKPPPIDTTPRLGPETTPEPLGPPTSGD